jgi:VTC domain
MLTNLLSSKYTTATASPDPSRGGATESLLCANPSVSPPLEGLGEVLSRFTPITLQTLDEVALLNRIDTKFVFHNRDLAAILEDVKDDYYVLEIAEKRQFRYESLYYDTPNYDLYKFHHNGKLNRVKIRYRRYMDSGLCYFEVKYKVNGGMRTDKRRFKTPEIAQTLKTPELALIYHPQLDNALLQPTLWIHFTRITLASRMMNERLTLDINLKFSTETHIQPLENLVIAEIKTEKSSFNSPIVKAFKARHYEQSGFSKYSIGTALLAPVKYNNFKPQLIKLAKILFF